MEDQDSSVVGHLPSAHEALGSMLSIVWGKKKEDEEKEEEEKEVEEEEEEMGHD